jgi:two-component system response regulator YesN
MSLRILINEADADLARRLGELLLAQGRGFDVIASHDGTAALEIVRRLHVDLLITGLETPGVGGLQLLTEIRRHLPGLKAIALGRPITPCPPTSSN